MIFLDLHLHSTPPHSSRPPHVPQFGGPSQHSAPMGSYQHYLPTQHYSGDLQAKGRQAPGPSGLVQPKVEKFDPEYGDDEGKES